MSNTGYVIFCEDKQYLLWQTELMLHSITTRAKVPINNCVVLFADPAYFDKEKQGYQPSPYMVSLQKNYHAKYHCVQNFGRRNWYFRFTDNGHWHPKQYPGINKWTSLCEAANAGWLDEFDEIVLLEQDLWFSGEMPVLPAGNCVTDNWINNRYRAFEVSDKEPHMNTPGFDLDDILKLCKVSSTDREKWVGGAIIFKWLTRELKQSKFLNAIVNYNQLLMNLGELALPQGARHETDMVAPNLAMAHCGMDCELVKDPCWRSDIWTWHQEPPERTVIHYGWDFNAYKHLKCTFNKFQYGDKPPWTDIEKYKKELPDVAFNWIRDFINDIEAVGKREMDRTCDTKVAVPVI